GLAPSPIATVLPQSALKRPLAQGEIAFDPPLEDDQWGDASVDLRLGLRFTTCARPTLAFPSTFITKGLKSLDPLHSGLRNTDDRIDAMFRSTVPVVLPSPFVSRSGGRGIWEPACRPVSKPEAPTRRRRLAPDAGLVLPRPGQYKHQLRNPERSGRACPAARF